MLSAPWSECACAGAGGGLWQSAGSWALGPRRELIPLTAAHACLSEESLADKLTWG